MTLSPNVFSCIEDYLSKFKKLRILCEECNIKLEKESCIYIILSKLGSAYSMFGYTFYGTEEDLGTAYKYPFLDSFCDALIRQQDKLVQLGVVSITSTSNKAIVN
jgi:hypothetical protein